MITQKMNFEQIVPFVRFASYLQLDDQSSQTPAVSYDHRLVYVVSGSGILDLADKEVSVGPGHILYWPSGTTYAFHPEEDEPLHLIIVNFDFTQENADILQPLPSVTPQGYQSGNRLEKLNFGNASVFENVISLNNVPAVLPYLQAMAEEAETPQIMNAFQQTNLLRVVLTILYRMSYSHLDRKASNSFNKILDYVYEHYDKPLSNKELAAHFNYHPNYISQLFTQHTGISLHQYLLRIRVRQALYLLQTTELSVSEVATKVGFGSTSYFCQYFKKSTGYSPASFKLNK